MQWKTENLVWTQIGIRLKLSSEHQEDMTDLSPERVQIAKIFKKYIEQAIAELGVGYQVDLLGKFDKTPIVIQLEITAKDGIP